MIRLPHRLDAAIRAEGEKTYPNECCGVLFGQIDSEGTRNVDEILPIDNARDAGEQYHRFRIEADDYLRAEQLAQEKGKEILGFYHSHPDHPAEPSEYDREYALPFYAYIIVAVEKGRATKLTNWTLPPARSHFEAEQVLAVTD